MAQYLLIAATVVSAIGSIQQGNAAAASAKSQANAAEYNAKVLRQNADQAYREGSAAEEAQRRRARQVLGVQRAAVGQTTGFTGTSLGVIEQSGTNAELDALNIRYESDMKARGLLQEADLETANAANYRSQAGALRTAGYISAGSKALSGGSSYYSQYGGGSTTLPWQQPGNVRPSYMGGGYY